MRQPSALAALGALLRAQPQHGANLVALHGEPADARAELARRVVGEAGDVFSAGALWLHAGPGVIPATTLAEAERLLHVAPGPSDSLDRRVARVCRALGGRGPALIALDSAHDAELPAWLAQRLLPPGGTLLLLTSDPALAAAVGASSVALDDQNGSRATRLAALCAAYDALMPDIQWRFRSLGALRPAWSTPASPPRSGATRPRMRARSRMAGRVRFGGARARRRLADAPARRPHAAPLLPPPCRRPSAPGPSSATPPPSSPAPSSPNPPTA